MPLPRLPLELCHQIFSTMFPPTILSVRRWPQDREAPLVERGHLVERGLSKWDVATYWTFDCLHTTTYYTTARLTTSGPGLFRG